MIKLKTLNILLSLIFTASFLTSQDNAIDKEIVIIEKTIDDQGNVISQSTKRYSGQYTEDQIQDLLEGVDEAPDIRSYDLDGLGFEENMRDLFKPRNSRPTLGVNLNFENGSASVNKVHVNSGAYEADIREGDIIISIANVLVSTIEDVYEALEKESDQETVKILIFRDGEEIEKEVQLSSKNQQAFPFSEGGRLRIFDNDDLGFTFDLDSLFGGLLGSEDLFKKLQPGESDSFRKRTQPNYKSKERASLGVFLEDEGLEVTVSEVVRDSPANKSGVLPGDIILSLDDNIVTSFREVSAYMNRKRIGDTLKLTINRDDTIITLHVIL